MKSTAVLLLALTLLATVPGVASARPAQAMGWRALIELTSGPGGRGDHGGGDRGGQQAGRPAISIDTAVERSRARVPRNARLLDAAAENNGGRIVYRVRWSVDGRRIDVLVDGNSGGIVGVED